MKIKNVSYTVEYYAHTVWDDPYSDRKTFDTEEEALAFIHELSKDPLSVGLSTPPPRRLVSKNRTLT